MRRIIQIGIAVDSEGSSTVLALAEDGTLWEGWRMDEGKRGAHGRVVWVFKWTQLPMLPE